MGTNIKTFLLAVIFVYAVYLCVIDAKRKPPSGVWDYKGAYHECAALAKDTYFDKKNGSIDADWLAGCLNTKSDTFYKETK